MGFLQLTGKHKIHLGNQSIKKSFPRALCACGPTILHSGESSAQRTGAVAGASQEGIILLAPCLLYACVCLQNILNINFGF